MNILDVLDCTCRMLICGYSDRIELKSTSPSNRAYFEYILQVVALETAKCGITCNAICPGGVDTPG